MAKINSKRITEIRDYGVCGYQVTFSVKDLYRLRYLAARVFDKCEVDTAECKLAEVISDLFSATIGGEAERDYDFLSGEKESV